MIFTPDVIVIVATSGNINTIKLSEKCYLIFAIAVLFPEHGPPVRAIL